ncbi:MAG TPA: hypothetical protein PLU87_11950 [Sedimentisphaerales bacterium]|nr:hypothetical protein [Sedimentisphaerales bacterium]HRS11750.1 hypothetical protein [Sedimentisphaerales bacterium]HRV48414.1 hypothetical protein [Sedimentisphaerales bacterium]
MTRQQIGRILSGGVMVLCVVLLITPVTHSQGFTATVKKFIISGSVGLPGVTMQGLPDAPTTDDNGVYTAEVPYGWSGTVTPVKLGYTFEPKQKIYQKVTAAMTEENYSAQLLTFKISGSAGQPGVVLKGLPGDPTSDASGRFSATVDYGWSGLVIPEKVGYRFEPAQKMYNPVQKDLLNENFTAREMTFTIAGSVGADGVVMKGLPGNPITSGGGVYRVEVPYNWSGKVTPTKEGHEFTPAEKTYENVIESATNENYVARVFTYRISGSTGLPGVTLEGLPDNPITDMDGAYLVTVPYGWSGKVTPVRPGYTFTPSSKNYTKVVEDHEGENYTPTIVQLTVSGNVGTSGVTLDGLPGNPVSDATGFYTAKVEYGWGGSVTPTKEGWSFEPSNKVYSSVLTDQSDQSYKASPIKFTISGSVIGLPGVMMDGLPGRPVTGPGGSYSAEVPYKWSGTVTPKKAGYSFEPSSRSYDGLLASQTSHDYQASIIQLTISGRIMSETGPLADVTVVADNNGGAAATDANGEFQLAVDYGWKGRITPTKEGYNFTPPNKALEAVMQNVPGVGFVGKVKMLTITDSIVFGTEPIQGVTITAQPTGATAVTDAKGKYTIQVPYGWTGDLIPTKEGFEFNPPSLPYANVTENIDKTAPARVTPPVTPPATTTSSVTTTPPIATPPAVTTTPSDATVDPQVLALQAERERLLKEIEVIRQQGGKTDGGTTGLPDLLPPLPTEEPAGPTQRLTSLPDVRGGGSTVLDVLTRISERTGVKIAVDATVKPDVVTVDFDVTTLVPMQVPLALQRILSQTKYKYKAVADTYLVYLPITNTWQGQDLRNVLQEIAGAAGVTIVPDPNVYGEVYAELSEVDLDTALRTVLAGSPFVVQKTPDYYLVADRSADSDAFPEISETHNVFLNYRNPRGIAELLSPAFAQYVRTSNDPNNRFVSVTAPPDLARRIVSEVKKLDLKPRQVLLDARVVAMEHSDLLNLGVEWGWPQISAGTFGTAFNLDNAGSWPWGIQIGYTPDQTFTDSLLMALNLLQQNSQAQMVANPQVLAQDGRLAELGVLTEEYFMLTPTITNNALFYSQTEMVKIESGTKLSITPRIGDNNDITLEMATEVSDSIPKAAGSDLPLVTRRTSRNVVTVRDGGTVALAGLTENRSKKIDKRVPGLSNLPLVGGLFKNTDNSSSSREIAVFVTAHLVPDGTTVRAGSVRMPSGPQPQPQPLGSGAQTATPAAGISRSDIEASLRNLR